MTDNLKPTIPIVKLPTIINEMYFKQYSPIPNNYNIDEIWNFVHTSEKLWIEPILGTPLYEELLEQVNKNEVTPENSTLLLQIYPYLCFATCYEALPFIAYHFNEVGITSGKSENSDSVSVKGINYISNQLRAQTEAMKSLLKKFLNEHSDTYPLYRPDDCGSCSENVCEDYFWIVDYYNGGYMEHDWIYYVALSEQQRKKPNPNLQLYTTRRPYLGRR
jgi:hypothetical protein